MVCCQSCLRKGKEASSCSRNRSFWVVLPTSGSSRPTGMWLESHVITAQLFSSIASNAPCVIVICLLSNTTTPISSIGRVTSADFLKSAERFSAFSTSGSLITSWASLNERYAGLLKHRVFFIIG